MTSSNDKGAQQPGGRPSRGAQLRPCAARAIFFLTRLRCGTAWRRPRGRCLRAMASARFARRCLRRRSCLRAAWARRRTSSRKRCSRGRTARAPQSEKAQILTLRPEITAGVVRAYIEHKMGETRRPAEALLHWAAVPAGETAAGTVPAVLADWRGGDWADEFGRRSRRCAMPRCWRCSRPCWMSWVCAGGGWS